MQYDPKKITFTLVVEINLPSLCVEMPRSSVLTNPPIYRRDCTLNLDDQKDVFLGILKEVNLGNCISGNFTAMCRGPISSRSSICTSPLIFKEII